MVVGLAVGVAFIITMIVVGSSLLDFVDEEEDILDAIDYPDSVQDDIDAVEFGAELDSPLTDNDP